ncbi:hypothetical protein T492DRAFT_1067619, partial [Pavlovales sp. CCMP2436]
MLISKKKKQDKVQAVRWHPSEPTVLLSGGFDKVTPLCELSTVCPCFSHSYYLHSSGDERNIAAATRT